MSEQRIEEASPELRLKQDQAAYGEIFTSLLQNDPDFRKSVEGFFFNMERGLGHLQHTQSPEEKDVPSPQQMESQIELKR
ncbi:hypothetical protein PROFUN_12252 [Planoprotostelium fungivorum]|uniref:Uncharacterized protein n=1 Tax=Planoprotostelium fungivorum TaxID=1890364 RepID=A0A2P6N814_9EUKA|nr:hypothetical protein PROFUN_12252 [Planoprotostelium fungivorum]